MRFKQFGHFHDLGKDGPGCDCFCCGLLFVAVFGGTWASFTTQSAHKRRSTLKPLIDLRDLQPVQYCVNSRRWPASSEPDLPIHPTITPP